MAPKGTVEVWDPEHRRQAERAALVRRRRHLTVVPPPPIPDAPVEQAPLVLDGDYAVEAPDLARYRLDGTGEGGEGR